MATTRAAGARRGIEAGDGGAPTPEGSGPGALPPGTPLPPAGAMGRVRPVVEAVRPQVEGGRYPAKCSVGESVTVEADVFTDGHDLVACELRYLHELDRRWRTAPMEPLVDDRWRGRFPVERLGRHRFAIRATVDRFATWRRDLSLRAAAEQDVSVELLVGADLLTAAAQRAKGADRRVLLMVAEQLRCGPRGLESDVTVDVPLGGTATLADLVFGPDLATLVGRHPDLGTAETSDTLTVVADPERARFSTWYELFPRSASPEPTRHGTFADVEGRLAYLERLGIDVLYLPPIHPIGRTNRKGADGKVGPGPADPGSPWAIGGPEGGHTAVHPELGSLAQFDHLVATAAQSGIAVALDLAFQCSPDHPWVEEHPQWFRRRPDGSVRHAENPPKTYEDIYPIDFETEEWPALWQALLGVVRFWVHHGVSVFRVDNPHTKPFRFWEWLISTVKAEDPEVLFLAEAFTRPKVMQRLAKVGFSQSYTYFTWRNAKWELEEYLTELTRTDVVDYFRPNFWPNTPDILTEALQHGGGPTFMARLVLAATLSANYGIYGPAFELGEHVARTPGSEEYANSEKYALRNWDLTRADSLADFVARVNQIRHGQRALQADRSLRFHHVGNDQLIAYTKTVEVPGTAAPGRPAPTDPTAEGEGGGDPDAPVLVVVNLDPSAVQSGWVALDLAGLGLAEGQPFEVHDLLTDAHYRWEGSHNFVLLDPDVVPAHVFVVRTPEVPAPGGPA